MKQVRERITAKVRWDDKESTSDEDVKDVNSGLLLQPGMHAFHNPLSDVKGERAGLNKCASDWLHIVCNLIVCS